MTLPRTCGVTGLRRVRRLALYLSYRGGSRAKPCRSDVDGRVASRRPTLTAPANYEITAAYPYASGTAYRRGSARRSNASVGASAVSTALLPPGPRNFRMKVGRGIRAIGSPHVFRGRSAPRRPGGTNLGLPPGGHWRPTLMRVEPRAPPPDDGATGPQFAIGDRGPDRRPHRRDAGRRTRPAARRRSPG